MIIVMYIVVIEPELQSEILSFIECAMSTLEINMPEFKIICG